MSGSIEIPFAIGETVWYAGTKQNEEQRPCVVCSGKKRIHVILGDGTMVGIDCDECERGWMGSTGVEINRYPYRSLPAVRPVTLVRVVRLDADGCDYTNAPIESGWYHSYSSKTLYRTQEDAQAAAEAECARRERECDEHNAKARQRGKGARGVPNMLAYFIRRRGQLRAELAEVERKIAVEQEAVR